ncbi:cob(I)yrinic acid a,c-diamide adenosyltransferase [candidate division TA06 bacterium SM1_40]|jgi:cob(I)alamin adenosyltransferase|uniref:Cob(I)yrinic acid a,c-diamide adenosyltransferase n=2 Tax=Bacteria division TA06 TaxID=1156500 RepID=A0A0S8JBN2_UNCT6|nr:MAG: cob(I)yrinic acid a,c-diamide adenosyltransferase [candidate division TA06 bacterium SM23_40]KPL06030.1 MAG: cob(I)yrinic acid a,c-diamide adenosyltransferase [candidate division TA06 bacterium SM1_40]
MSPLSRGTVQVYTGKGKGKTTAALGAAVRALGHGFTVCMIQFMKGDPNYGELLLAEKIPGFTIVQSGLPTFVAKGNPGKEDLRLAREGMKLARDAVTGGEYDIVILDEINVAIDYGLVSVKDVVDLIDVKPLRVEMILTGRYAPSEIIERADLVSEVREVKHHYHSGLEAREGVEY